MRYPIPITVLLCLIYLSEAASVQADEPAPATYQRPEYLTRYDIATPDYLFAARMLEPFIVGDEPGEWTLLQGLADQLGDWIGQYVAANRIANTINHAFPVEGQPALAKINQIVADCSAILHVEKPTVFIRSSPWPRCYLVEAGEQNFLILTSALLHLFEGKEAELRFVIGRELGHLKLEHAKLMRAAYAVLAAIREINLAVVPKP